MVSADTGVMYVAPSGGGVPVQVGGLPAGVIVMWSGLLSAIPPGWLLCDGQNGTPDLRDRFITGATAGQNPGATGGANTHTHADHGVTQPTLSGATSAGTAHTHTLSWPASVPTVSGIAASFSGSALATHAHELPFQIPSTTTTRQVAAAMFGTGTSRAATAVSATGTANTTSAAVALSQAISAGTPAGTVTITNQGAIAWPASVPAAAPESAHTHAVGTLAATGTAVTAHSTANNVPLFFALAFLMKAA